MLNLIRLSLTLCLMVCGTWTHAIQLDSPKIRELDEQIIAASADFNLDDRDVLNFVFQAELPNFEQQLELHKSGKPKDRRDADRTLDKYKAGDLQFPLFAKPFQTGTIRRMVEYQFVGPAPNDEFQIDLDTSEGTAFAFVQGVDMTGYAKGQTYREEGVFIIREKFQFKTIIGATENGVRLKMVNLKKLAPCLALMFQLKFEEFQLQGKGPAAPQPAGQPVEPGPMKQAVEPKPIPDIQDEMLGELEPESKVPLRLTKSGISLVSVDAGTFAMGTPRQKTGDAAQAKRELQHEVSITRSFQMSTFEISQGEWKKVMGTEPWKGQENVTIGDDFPASCIDWKMAVQFCEKLTALEGRKCRLPTEAEWEFACRGNTTTEYFWGDAPDTASDYGWWGAAAKTGSSEGDPTPRRRGQKKPNPLGLYDLNGNVWEWCHDWYGEGYYASSPNVDPQGPAQGSSKVIRGGSIWNSCSDFRSANRGSVPPTYRNFGMGLRIVVEMPDK